VKIVLLIVICSPVCDSNGEEPRLVCLLGCLVGIESVSTLATNWPELPNPTSDTVGSHHSDGLSLCPETVATSIVRRDESAAKRL
jgi:hypothetical protein